MISPAQSAFAVLTPPGRGGIAVLRCVGPGVAAVLKACFRPARATGGAAPDSTGGTPTPPLRGHASANQEHAHGNGAVGMPPAGHLAYGHIIDADGRRLDEIILCSLSGPHAEPAVEPAAGAAADAARAPIFEVNCHGGPAAVAAVAARLAALGLERVDADRLLEIEGASRIERDARRLLRTAHTALAARILLDQLGGALAGAIARILEQLAANRAAEASGEIDALLARWGDCGRFLAHPPRIVIAGRPNVGKSTLLNRLVGADRAITSPTPGTTRDYVEADAALDGVPVILVDTAGLGQASNEIERLGVERAHGEVARASLVVYLLDAREEAGAEDEAMLRLLAGRGLAVWNKTDLPGHGDKMTAPPGASGALEVSALTGEGITALATAVLARLGYRPTRPGAAVPFTQEQAEALRKARQLVDAGDAAAARQALAVLTEAAVPH